MKNKKQAELDILGDSSLPSDLFTPSLGSSYLIGEDPDLEYGMGVLDGVLNPEYTKGPALPTGLNHEASERMALEEYLMTPEITHLEWLDPDQLQDPERLPKDPHESLPELEELWGASTDGVTVQANTVDLEKLRYEQSLESRTVPVKKFSERTFEKVVTAAMRRSAMGQDINTIIKETLESVGEDQQTYVRAMKQIKAEHGLTGNVYIRKSAFPNFESGKWNDHIRKYHSDARYIVVAKEDFGKTFIEDGRCRYTGKLAVLEVPWKDAYKHYAPRLKSAGYKVASNDPRNALRIAFLRGPEEVKVETRYDIERNPADLISKRRARQEFDAYTPERKVYDPTAKQEKKVMAAVETKLQTMVRDLGLPQKEANAILSSGAHPKDMIKSASFIVSRVESGKYSGHEGGLESLITLQAMQKQRDDDSYSRGVEELSRKMTSSAKEAINDLVRREFISRNAADHILSSSFSEKKKIELATKLASTARRSLYEGDNQFAKSDSVRSLNAHEDLTSAQNTIQARVKQKEFESSEEGKIARTIQNLAGKIEHEISRGIKGSTLKSFIQRTVPKQHMRSVLATVKPLLDKTGALKQNTQKVASYEGTVFTEEKAETQQRGVLAGNLRKASQWLRRTMSEGFAGKELDSLLQNKFSDALLKAGSEEFSQIRKQHEGASGFLYVDASAYASETGSKGCEDAASKHRTNGIPAVASMDRCGSCAHRRVLEDGTPRCAIFNKTLLVDVETPDALKQRNIDSTNMTDAEATASLFSSMGAEVYNPEEFGLKNSNLEEIQFEDMPETEKISKILFNGWDID